MGLIKAIGSAIGSTISEQFLEGISCDNMSNDVLMVKISDEKGVISKGSKILVAPGQIAVLYDNGKILDATAEAGVYTFDSSTTPSFFGGEFGKVFKEMWERFKFGGATYKEQAVYFFNAKEIMDNKFGTATPIPYRDWGHMLQNARTNGLAPMAVDIRCYGKYTFKIADPALFMSQVAGHGDIYRKEDLVEQIRSEVVSSFMNVLNSLSEADKKVEAFSLPNQTDEIKEIMDESIFDKAIRERGIMLVSFTVESVTLTDESRKKIDEYEFSGDSFSQKGKITGAYADAVFEAAKNKTGSVNGFMGIGMMNMASGNVFGATAASANNVANTNNVASTSNNVASESKIESWKCAKCGTTNNSNFCSECGTPKNEKIKCPKCGNELEAGDKFCRKCGEEI